jgi:TonB family protein
MTAFAHGFSLALLYFLWQGTLVAILLWIALLAMRKRSAQARYVVSCAALAVLILLPAATAYVLYERPAPVSGVELAGSSAQPPASALPVHTANWVNAFQVWAVPAWCFGVLFFSARLVWGSRQVSLMRRRGEVAEEPVRAAVARIAERMGLNRPIGVLISALADGPSVVGILRPVILLPAATILGLTPEQLEAVLAHELAHIRRFDYLVNVLQVLAEALLFYHPAVWWTSARIRRERELCCDDEAVRSCGDAFCYARALTTLERIRVMTPRLALGSTDGPLAYRIKRLIGAVPEDNLPSKIPGVVALCLALGCLGISVNRVRAQAPDAPGVRVDLGSSAVIHRGPVPYPAQIQNVKGTVSVEVHLDGNGNVSDARALSGPEELRKPVLQSVLGWHFTPNAAGSTRVVNVEFQTPSQDKPRAIARMANPADRAAELEETVQVLKAELDRTKADLEQTQPLNQNQGSNKDREAEIHAALDVLQARMEAARAQIPQQQETGIPPEKALQLEATIRFLKAEIDQAKANLAQPQAQNLNPDAIKARESEIEARRAEYSALEAKLLAAQLAQGQSPQPVFRNGPMGPTLDTIPHAEPLVLPPLMAQQFEGRTLQSVRLAGIGMSTEDFLAQAQVPVRAGDTLTQSSIEATVAAVKKFDGHLGERWTPVEPNGMELTIFAPGAPGPRGAGVGGGIGAGVAPQASSLNGNSAPAVVYRADPEYTDEAKNARWQGTVVLSVTVDETGKPTSIRVVKPLGMGLDQKAIEAVEKWQFKPGMKDGKTAPVTATIEVNFRLP